MIIWVRYWWRRLWRRCQICAAPVRMSPDPELCRDCWKRQEHARNYGGRVPWWNSGAGVD